MPDRPPRSTCAQPIWPTWDWPARRTCRSWSSATSTAAACWPICSAPSRCSCPEDQALIAGFVVNKFRGDPALLAPGLDQLEALTGRPTYGVVPFSDELWLDAEDSVSVVARQVVGVPQPPRGEDWLRVAAIRLPRISNSTDVEALACEPGVLVRWVTDPAELADADVMVLPGSKATVADLGGCASAGWPTPCLARPVGPAGPRYLRRLPDAVPAHRRHRRDPSGPVAGLGLLDADIEFAAEKVLRHWDGPLGGYEIHHGRVTRCAEAGWFEADGSPQGYARGAVYGTHWHGLLDNDGFRRGWLRDAAAAAGRPGFRVADDISVPARRDAQLDVMADLLSAHLDVDALLGLLDGGPPVRPTVTSALRR